MIEDDDQEKQSGANDDVCNRNNGQTQGIQTISPKRRDQRLAGLPPCHQRRVSGVNWPDSSLGPPSSAILLHGSCSSPSTSTSLSALLQGPDKRYPHHSRCPTSTAACSITKAPKATDPVLRSRRNLVRLCCSIVSVCTLLNFKVPPRPLLGPRVRVPPPSARCLDVN